MTIASIDVLARVPLLAGLDRRDLQRLAKELKPRTFTAGKSATEEGRSGVGFFIVLGGTATVSIAGAEVRRIGPGDYFGEIALLSDDGVRTATITADTDLQCAGLTTWEFRPFLSEHPEIAWSILQTMATRAGDAN